MTTFELIDRFRRGGTVRRYHTHRLLRPPNNAEHQWGVAMIVDHLWRAAGYHETPPQLIVKALYHDVPEYDTGDMPAWVKRGTDLGAHINEIEAGVAKRLGIEDPEPGMETHILKAADELEHLWTCLDERRLGNTDLSEMFAGGIIRCRELFKTWHYSWSPIALDMLSCLELEYMAIGGSHYDAVREATHHGGGYFQDNPTTTKENE